MYEWIRRNYVQLKEFLPNNNETCLLCIYNIIMNNAPIVVYEIFAICFRQSKTIESVRPLFFMYWLIEWGTFWLLQPYIIFFFFFSFCFLHLHFIVVCHSPLAAVAMCSYALLHVFIRILVFICHSMYSTDLNVFISRFIVLVQQ